MSDQDIIQCQEFVKKLHKDEERLNALRDLKNLLSYKSNTEAVNTLKKVGFTKILECVNVKDGNEVDLTCELLKLCFDKFDVGEVVRNYTGYIMFLLRHEKACVRRIAVDEVYKTVTTDKRLLPFPKFTDVFVAIGQLVADEDVAIANKAILITSNLNIEAYPKVLEEMKIALEGNNSSKCNAYEVITNISAKSPKLLEQCAQQGYIDLMLSELSSDDILYQMNILELLSRLAITTHGIEYLVENGTLQRISDLLADLKVNPLGYLLIPGYMKFFGSVAHLYPRQIFENYPALIESLFEALESGDQTILPAALDTLGFIGATIEGKLSLAALGSRFTSAISQVNNLIRTSVTEIKIRALLCMAGLIGYEKEPNLPKNKPIDHRVTLMTREWFRCLSEKPDAMEMLHNICKNPFSDIRLAGFSLLDAVCQHQWGEELVARTPGFLEFLLDRSVDYTIESKEAKYDIIKRLSRSAAFDASTLLNLKKYVEEGSCYAEQTLQVAMEEGD